MDQVSAAVANVFQPSPQQGDFFDWVKTGSGSCILRAVAGAGKTTTLIQALDLMKGYVFFGAFNKAIVKDIEDRTGERLGLTVKTLHSAGNSTIYKAGFKPKINDHKCRDIFRAACVRNPTADYEQYEGAVLSLVSYAKQAALGLHRAVEDSNAWLELIEHFSVDCLGNESLVIALSKKTLAASNKTFTESIDFDDMIYIPAIKKMAPKQYDWVLIDEAQDTNAGRRALALMMLKPGGRLVAVGDEHQAIYGFTGADSDALHLIAKATNAVWKPLTVTYRCPKAVAAYAKRWVSHIEAHESAPDGKVTQLPDGQTLLNTVKPGDAILCRFNAPLIPTVYQFIAAGVPAKVLGSDIGEGLKKLANRWKSVRTYTQLLDKLKDYCEREVAKFKAKEQETAAGQLVDKVNCLNIIIKRAEKLDPHSKTPCARVAQEIDMIFADGANTKVVLLSSIHKAKGREWNNVVWLQTGPSPYARQAWELQAEDNLCYVATTRAKQNLILTSV